MGSQRKNACVLLLLLALVACGGSPTPTTDAVGTEVAVKKPVSAAPTAYKIIGTSPSTDATTPTPTATNTHSSTPTSTSTDRPTPTSRLTETATVACTPCPTATQIPASTPTETATAQTLERIGQIGGVSKAVAVQGDYAYLNVGPRLIILDIANPARPVIVGQSSPLPGLEDLAIAGSHAYVAAGEGGVHILDISDPVVPTEVGLYEMPGAARSIAVKDGTAYVATDAGLQILDISNPVAPIGVGFHGTADAAADVAVVGNIAYLTEAFSAEEGQGERGGLRIVDVSNPADPSEIGFYPMNPLGVDEFERPSAPRGLEHVAVVGDTAYLTYHTERRGGLRTVDISDPTNPREIGDYQDYVYYVSDVTIVESPLVGSEGVYAYVGTGVNFGLLVLDVTDPAVPTVLAHQVPGWAHGMALTGDTLFFADEAGGLHITDVSDPAHPVEVGSYDVLADARDVVVAADRAFVTDGLYDLWLVDTSNPAHPTPLGVFSAPGGIQGVVAAGDKVYLAAETAGLLVVDISDPAQPTQVGALNTPGLAHGVAVAGDHAYVADGQLQVVDISDPAAPLPAAAYESEARIEDVIIEGNLALLTNNGLQVLDISEPTQPLGLGSLAASGGIREAVAGDGYAYLLVRGDLVTVDLSSAAHPVEVSRLEFEDVSEYGGSVALAGDYAYLAGERRLHVIDISDPTSPKEALSYDALIQANGIAAGADHIYVAEGLSGLAILRHSSKP